MDLQKDNKSSQVNDKLNTDSLIDIQSPNRIPDETNQQIVRPVIPPLGPDKGSPANIFNPVDNNKGQKKGNNTFLCCCCSVISILVLIVIVLVLLSLFTNINIPILSNLLSRYNSNPQKEAETATKNLAGTVVGMFSQLTGPDESIFSDFVKTDVTQDVIKEQIESYSEIKSVRYEATIEWKNINGYLDSNENSKNDTKLDLAGTINNLELDDQKQDVKFVAKIKTTEKENNYMGEVKEIGRKTYFIITEFPDNYSEFVKTIKDQWIEMEASDTSEMTGFVTSGAEIESQEITNEKIDKLIQFLTDESVTKNAKYLKDENIKGSNCKCISLSWNNEEFKNVIKTYSQIYNTEYNEEKTNESLKNVGRVIANICTNESSSYVQKFKMIWEGKSSDMGDLVNINLILWDFNQEIDIERPEATKTFEELLVDIYE